MSTYSRRTPLLKGVAMFFGCDIGYSCLLLFGIGKGNSGWQCGPIGLQNNVIMLLTGSLVGIILLTGEYEGSRECLLACSSRGIRRGPG